MKSSLLALFKFTICTTWGFTQNLRSFVVVLHDFPLEVEKTELYNLVKSWRSPEDVQDATLKPSFELPEAFPLKETETESVQFFKQSHYRDKPKEEARLLCWAKTKNKIGFFSFSLPEVVSTRFISLVATGVHSTYNDRRETVNVDLMKFIPHGALVPCL